jgi:hypothetical protein
MTLICLLGLWYRYMLEFWRGHKAISAASNYDSYMTSTQHHRPLRMIKSEWVLQQLINQPMPRNALETRGLTSRCEGEAKSRSFTNSQRFLSAVSLLIPKSTSPSIIDASYGGKHRPVSLRQPMVSKKNKVAKLQTHPRNGSSIVVTTGDLIE